MLACFEKLRWLSLKEQIDSVFDLRIKGELASTE